jgi:hypothetical protein
MKKVLVVLVAVLALVGCGGKDNPASGNGNNGGGDRSGLVLPDGQAWVMWSDDYYFSDGFIFRSDGTILMGSGEGYGKVENSIFVIEEHKNNIKWSVNENRLTIISSYNDPYEPEYNYSDTTSINFNISGNTLNLKHAESGESRTYTKTNGIYVVNGKIDNNLVLPQGQAWTMGTGYYDWSNIGTEDVLELAAALVLGFDGLDVLATVTALMLEAIGIGDDYALVEYLEDNGLYSKYQEIMEKYEYKNGMIFQSNGTLITVKNYDSQCAVYENPCTIYDDQWIIADLLNGGEIGVPNGGKWFVNGDVLTIGFDDIDYYSYFYFVFKYKISGNKFTLGDGTEFLTKTDGVNPVSMSPLSKSPSAVSGKRGLAKSQFLLAGNRVQKSALLRAR